MNYNNNIKTQLNALWREAIAKDFGLFLHQSFCTLNSGYNFIDNWHIRLLAEYLQAVETGHLHRLIINMPPRYLKSLCISVAWPAWILGATPNKRIIVASYASSLSIKHSLDCRHLITSPWYNWIYPNTKLMKGQNEKQKFVTTAHGFRMATSVGGAVTGEGGDILIVDDPLNPLQAESKLFRNLTNRWFEHSFSSRLNDKNKGAIVIVMQRLHHEDLSGFLLQKGNWELLELAAIATKTKFYYCNKFTYRRSQGTALHPQRENISMLKRIKREMGSYAFAAQYQQQPITDAGAMVKRAWLQYYHPQDIADIISNTTLHERYESPHSTSAAIIQSWDTAIKAGCNNDPTTCITIMCYNNRYYLLDILREWLEYPKLYHRLTKLAQQWKPQAILLEDKASGQSLIQDLRHSTTLPIIACTPVYDKITRFAATTPIIESGRLWLPRNAVWLAEFEQELLSFPNSKYDDQIDALSQFLNWQRHKLLNTNGQIRRI